MRLTFRVPPHLAAVLDRLCTDTGQTATAVIVSSLESTLGVEAPPAPPPEGRRVEVSEALDALAAATGGLTATELAERLSCTVPEASRALAAARRACAVVCEGRTRATRYHLAAQ